MKQQTFKGLEKPKRYFGGEHLKNSHAKRERPLSGKDPIHLVMRSDHAKGPRSMRSPHNFAKTNELFRATAKKHGIRVYKFANVGNHLHAVIRTFSRPQWRAFIRELSGRLSQLLQKLGPNEKGVLKFWSQRPFTRIAAWGRDYNALIEYVEINSKEAAGLCTRHEIKWLRTFRQQHGLEAS